MGFQRSAALQLGHRDWAIELPAAEVGRIRARPDDQFSDPDLAKRFTSRGNAWASFVPEWPGFQFHKEGTFIKACAGLDIQGKVPGECDTFGAGANTLRCKVSLEVDIDDWDSFKCEVVSLLDPFAGLITAIDLGVPWYAFPLVAILQPLLPIAFGLGGDDILVREAIKKVQEGAAKKGVTIVRVDDTHFFADVSKQVTTALTRDWLIVEEVAASETAHPAGGFTAPDLQRLPRLRGTDRQVRLLDKEGPLLTNVSGHCRNLAHFEDEAAAVRNRSYRSPRHRRRKDRRQAVSWTDDVADRRPARRLWRRGHDDPLDRQPQECSSSSTNRATLLPPHRCECSCSPRLVRELRFRHLRRCRARRRPIARGSPRRPSASQTATSSPLLTEVRSSRSCGCRTRRPSWR